MSHGSPGTDAIYGLMAEFDNPTDLVAAANRARLEGYRDMDAYSPMPIEELNEALGIRKTKLPLIVLIGGICGGLGGYMLEYWSSVIAYPLNIGGRPFHSWPQFIPVTFECTILLGGLTAAISMIIMNGLPSPYHPVFNVERFANASRSKFFLCIESEDPRFDRTATEGFLASLGPEEIAEVVR